MSAWICPNCNKEVHSIGGDTNVQCCYCGHVFNTNPLLGVFKFWVVGGIIFVLVCFVLGILGNIQLAEDYPSYNNEYGETR